MISALERLGGPEALRALVERFYDLVETRPEGATILSLHFRGHGMAHVRAEQFDFLMGFLGGRRIYAERHGHMDLRDIHAHVPIRPEDAEDWLFCMNMAMDDCKVAEPLKGQIMRVFTRAAHVLVNRPTDRP
ncbi:MAG: group II truncated hemoglobin [Paracoccaceae bacterium]